MITPGVAPLDTHVLVWLDLGMEQLGGKARKLAERAQRESHLAVSAISFWEVAMLVERGRIALDRTVTAWRMDLIELGIQEIPVDGEIGILSVGIAGLHGDPADRILIATAQARDATFLTADDRILRWPGSLRRQDARK